MTGHTAVQTACALHFESMPQAVSNLTCWRMTAGLQALRTAPCRAEPALPSREGAASHLLIDSLRSSDLKPAALGPLPEEDFPPSPQAASP